MTQYKYVFQGYDAKKMARAVGLGLNISSKQAIEICNHLKHRSLDAAKEILNAVLKMKQAIPYKRFNKDIPHRPGMMAGRYPQNASNAILKLLESAESNANSKGLTTNLFVTHMSAHRAPAIRRGGRVPGEAKRAHVEVVLEEKVAEKKAYVSKKSKEGKTK